MSAGIVSKPCGRYVKRGGPLVALGFRGGHNKKKKHPKRGHKKKNTLKKHPGRFRAFGFRVGFARNCLVAIS